MNSNGYLIDFDQDGIYYDEARETIVVGDVTHPGHDYQCLTCLEIFEVRYRRDDKPVAVTCPICNTGDTHKLIAMPATSIWWRNPLASSDAAEMAPRFRTGVKNKRR
jgi:putative FmdB family regulatory protein